MSRLRTTLTLIACICIMASTTAVAADPEAPTSAPYTCAVYPIMAFGSDIFLYYSDYYPSGCDDTPQAAYLYGNYAWPMQCPDCVQGSFLKEERGAKAAPGPAKPFPGLNAPFDPGF